MRLHYSVDAPPRPAAARVWRWPSWWRAGLTLGLCWVLGVAGCGREPSETAPADHAAASTETAAIEGVTASGLSLEALGNGTYPSQLLEGETVTLLDGRFQDAARGLSFQVLPAPIGHGMLDGRPVAAVLLAENGGGSGTFVSLVLFGQGPEGPERLAATALGDRPRVRSITISPDGSLRLGLVQVGERDQFCCPTKPMWIDYRYADGALIVERARTATIDAAGFADVVNAFTQPSTAYDRSEPPGGQGEPEHFAWTFGPDSDLMLAQAQVPGHGYVAVYPVASFRAIWSAAGDSFVDDTLRALEALLAARPLDPEPPLPGLPLRNAVNDFAAQVAYLDLPDGGRAIRFVGRYSQDAAPLRNDQLRYVFQGLSADGEWLIIASLPIRTASLPDDTAVAVIDPAAPQNDIVAHLGDWRRTLDSLTPDAFDPSLDAFDGLLRSVSVSTTHPEDAEATAPAP